MTTIGRVEISADLNLCSQVKVIEEFLHMILSCYSLFVKMLKQFDELSLQNRP